MSSIYQLDLLFSISNSPTVQTLSAKPCAMAGVRCCAREDAVGSLQGTMDAGEVEICDVQSHGILMVFQILGIAQCLAGETAVEQGSRVKLLRSQEQQLLAANAFDRGQRVLSALAALFMGCAL